MPRFVNSRRCQIEYADVDFCTVADRCAQLMAYLFTCNKHPQRCPQPCPHSNWQQSIAEYISGILRRTGLDITVAICAMILLSRYKENAPNVFAHDCEAYDLFLSAYIVAAYSLGHRRRSLEYWSSVGGNLVSPYCIKDMEAHFSEVIDYDIRIDQEVFIRFSSLLHQDFLKDRDTDSFAPGSPPPRYEDSRWDILIVERTPRVRVPRANPETAPIQPPETPPSGHPPQARLSLRLLKRTVSDVLIKLRFSQPC